MVVCGCGSLKVLTLGSLVSQVQSIGKSERDSSHCPIWQVGRVLIRLAIDVGAFAEEFSQNGRGVWVRKIYAPAQDASCVHSRGTQANGRPETQMLEHLVH